MPSLFQEAWIVAGKPKARVYPPIDTWTLPAGVSYNPFNNTFVDEDDVEVTVDPDTAAVDGAGEPTWVDHKYVPGDTQKFPNIGPAGHPVNWDAEIYVELKNETSFRESWGVNLPSGIYTIERILRRPEAMPLILVVTLVKVQEGAT
jgi:hypothetical protein